MVVCLRRAVGALGAALLVAAACEGTIEERDGGGDDASVMDADGGLADAGGPPRLEVTPGSHDFGDALVGGVSAPVTVTVRNAGGSATSPLSMTLTGPRAPEFSIDDDQCSNAKLGAGLSCTMVLTFRPTASGAASAALGFSASPGGTAGMTLEGRGLGSGALTITPPTHDYGLLTIGTPSATQTFTVFNGGGMASGALAVNLGGTDAGEFEIVSDGCDGATLAVSASCDVSVRYAPSLSGARHATLSVMGTPGGAAVAQLEGRGQTPATLSVMPASHDFAQRTVGTTSPGLDVTVGNLGGQGTGALTVSKSGAGAAHFVISMDGCHGMALEGGASCTLRVTHAPGATGAQAATLSISGTPGGTRTVMLSGTGVTAAALGMMPGSHAFGSVTVGQASATRTFTVTNSGMSPTGTLTTTITGATPGDFALTADGCTGATLDGGAACTVIVALAPATAGAKSATLAVSGAPGGSATATLGGTGLTPAALAIAPTPHTFAATTVGQVSATQTFTVSNTGQSTSGALTVTLGGGGAGHFSIVSNGCVGTLGAGASCQVVARFAPTTSGAKSATLGASATPGGTATAMLSGSALTAAALAIAPTSHGFGAVTVGQQSGTRTFTVSNTGQSTSGAVTVALGGADPGHFTIVTNGCSGTLVGGASCQVVARFTPTLSGAGARTAALAASATPGGTATATISGTGLTVAQLAVTPTPFGFGNVTVGQQSGTQTFTVSNTGQSTSGAVTVGLGGANPGQFTLVSTNCGPALPGLGNCTAVVRFAPSSAGAKSALVTASASPGGTASAQVSGTGLTPALLSIAPTPHVFAATTVGGVSATQLFTVSNGGQSTSGVPMVSSTGDFQITTHTCSAGVPGGGACTITARFAPTVAGTRNGTIVASATPGGTATAMVSGNGLTPAALALAPPSHGFGNVTTGATSATFDFTLSNSGQSPSGVPMVGLGGGDAGQFAIVSNGCTGAVPGGGMCTITVRFAPTTAGPKNATLNVSASPGGVDSSALTGTGLTPAVLAIAPPAGHAFGDVVIGASAALEFTITNTGQSASGAVATMLSGTGYSVTSSTCAASLPGGDSCTIEVTFAPLVTGAHPGTLGVSASPGGSPSVPLSGNGITPAKLELTPSPHDFGLVQPGTQSAPQKFTVTNAGEETSGDLVLSITGSGATHFAIVMGTDACSGQKLAGGDSCSFEVVFDAPLLLLGDFTALLRATATPGGTSDSTLTGSNFDP